MQRLRHPATKCEETDIVISIDGREGSSKKLADRLERNLTKLTFMPAQDRQIANQKQGRQKQPNANGESRNGN